MANGFEDLTGQKFGKLTVVKRADDKVYKNGDRRTRWHCVCDCGCDKDIIVLAKLLKNNHTTSCGCTRSERVSQFNKNTKSKPNKCEIVGNIAVMYTSKGEQFYIDAEDLPKVKPYTWYFSTDGYVVSTATTQKQSIRLQRIITDCPNDKMVDHIAGSNYLFDNRKCNLRIVTASQNQMNRKLSSNNTSGCHGVKWDKQCKKWRALITINGRCLNLGLFDELDDCIKARKEAEKEYFGEYSYDYSQAFYQKINE